MFRFGTVMLPFSSGTVMLPAWIYACCNPNCYASTMPEVKTIYLSLPPDVRNIIVLKDYKPRNKFWRLQKEPQLLYDELVEVGTVDAATGILALIKEAETNQNQLQHQLGITAWAKCAAKLKSDPVLGSLLSEINAYIEIRFRDSVYFLAADASDISKLGKEKVQAVWKEHGPKEDKSTQANAGTNPISPWKRTFPELRRKKASARRSSQ